MLSNLFLAKLIHGFELGKHRRQRVVNV